MTDYKYRYVELPEDYDIYDAFKAERMINLYTKWTNSDMQNPMAKIDGIESRSADGSIYLKFRRKDIFDDKEKLISMWHMPDKERLYFKFESEVPLFWAEEILHLMNYARNMYREDVRITEYAMITAFTRATSLEDNVIGKN